MEFTQHRAPPRHKLHSLEGKTSDVEEQRSGWILVANKQNLTAPLPTPTYTPDARQQLLLHHPATLRRTDKPHLKGKLWPVGKASGNPEKIGAAQVITTPKGPQCLLVFLRGVFLT